MNINTSPTKLTILAVAIAAMVCGFAWHAGTLFSSAFALSDTTKLAEAKRDCSLSEADTATILRQQAMQIDTETLLHTGCSGVF